MVWSNMVCKPQNPQCFLDNAYISGTFFLKSLKFSTNPGGNSVQVTSAGSGSWHVLLRAKALQYFVHVRDAANPARSGNEEHLVVHQHGRRDRSVGAVVEETPGGLAQSTGVTGNTFARNQSLEKEREVKLNHTALDPTSITSATHELNASHRIGEGLRQSFSSFHDT